MKKGLVEKKWQGDRIGGEDGDNRSKRVDSRSASIQRQEMENYKAH